MFPACVEARTSSSAEKAAKPPVLREHGGIRRPAAPKARLSELLERVAAGEEIVITSDGRPKAKLVGIPTIRTPYRVNRRLLNATTHKPCTSAEELIRLDRDGRD